jgi:hypothetical protein
MDPAEIEKVGKNLRDDMDEIGNDLDNLLKEGTLYNMNFHFLYM